MKKTWNPAVALLALLAGCIISEQEEPAPQPESGLPGRYSGVSSCSDCVQVRTTLTLFSDHRFSLKRYEDRQDGMPLSMMSGLWRNFGKRIELFPDPPPSGNERWCFASVDADVLVGYDRACAPFDGGEVLKRLSSREGK